MVAHGTVANILKKHGIEPSPQRNRQTNWKEFLSRHWELLVAADFFTVEVWTRRGLQRFRVLFFIDLSSRRVKIAGIRAKANGLWMSQIGRNQSDPIDGLFVGKQYLMHDRDPLFTAEFLEMLADIGIQSVKLPPRSPKPERLRGTLCTHDQGVVLGPIDTLWRGLTAESDPRVRGALPSGKKSSRTGQPAHYSPGYSDRL